MSNDTIRQLSSSLFAEIKPYCVELTNVSLLPDQLFRSESSQLSTCLGNVQNTLEAHYRQHKDKVARYQLAPNVADYVFYPLSNLLKKPSLNDSVIGYILSITAFLLSHVWSFNPNQTLIDQLYPLVVFLMGGSTPKESKVLHSNIEFKAAGLACLDQIISSLPKGYFSAGDNPSTKKNLALLGNTITLLLDILSGSTNPNSVEETQLVNDCLSTLEALYSRHMTPEQLSHVLPGTVSKIVNFYAMSKTLHYTVIVNMMKLLTCLIGKVFDDESLNIELQDQAKMQKSLEELGDMWDKGQDQNNSIETALLSLPFNIPSSNHHRTNSWLRATSKQLKISLTILFKDLLSPSSNNKSKVQTKAQIEFEIVSFVKTLLDKCFISLFNEFISLALDIFPMLISSVSESRGLELETNKIDSFSHVICLNGDENGSDMAPLYLQKLSYIYKYVFDKLEGLIKSRISSIMMSVDNDRIRMYIISIKFQFTVLSQLSQILRRGENHIFQLKSALVNLLQKELVRGFLYNDRSKKYGSKDILTILSGSENNQSNGNVVGNEMQVEEEVKVSNKFEDIELPPQIDASKIVKMKRKGPRNHINNFDTTNMILMSKQDWIHSQDVSDLTYFGSTYSVSVEHQIVELIKFLGRLDSTSSVKLIEDVLSMDFPDSNGQPEAENYLHRSVNLWFANNLLTQVRSARQTVPSVESQGDFNIDDFLDFNEDKKGEVKHISASTNYTSSQDHEIENISYMIMGKSQDLIDDISTLLNNPELISTANSINSYKVYEMTYSVAIDSIGILSNSLELKDFQQDFLIDYLYPLLEALTFQSNPLIQSHAKQSLQQIVNNYYDGSLESMIVDNSDYLIDCLSSKLSVVTSLSPSLAGILLVVLKISGIKLLLSNQLSDIISEMFTLIDSYHGYSVLVEGFFVVFDEIVQQVEEYYAINKVDANTKSDDEIVNYSKYKPWGMTNVNQLLKMIDDSQKIVDPFNDYDSNKEYFKRKQNVPFAEQMADSDDEDADDENQDEGNTGNNENAVDEWKSRIPRSIYDIIQRIFNYSFRLLSHPSTTLRHQILKMLTKVYPILSTNYNMVLPLISKHWPIIMTLVVGTNSLSTYEAPGSDDTYLESANLVLPAVELTTVLIKEDRKQNEAFLGRKFLELWEFLTTKNEMFKLDLSERPRKPSTSSLSKIMHNPNILSGYANLVITGLNVYERIISDKIAYEMVSFCWRCGISDKSKFDHSQFSKETKNIIWLLKRNHREATIQQKPAL
ncbi:TEL2-interacting protein 1 [[Candida] railenensis]|uniref:TEL2-interacting protein 1 n=1 Tax=[Candida] railenensis TaxID=45579 RepID=A0A9P0QLH6_9ASCO|nr:TEL2-interacting protein 1 [[Candida] railenensis]